MDPTGGVGLCRQYPHYKGLEQVEETSGEWLWAWLGEACRWGVARLVGGALQGLWMGLGGACKSSKFCKQLKKIYGSKRSVTS